MNTIQLTTIQKTAQVQIIEVNSRFTVKALKAKWAIDNLLPSLIRPEELNDAQSFIDELVNALEDNENNKG